jgi:LysM repeat protein
MHTAARKGHWALFVVLLLVMMTPQWAQAQPANASQLVYEVNEYRASLGLGRLPTHGALMVAAQRHAEWMARTGTYSHSGEGGSSPTDRAVAAGYSGYVFENVAGSNFSDPSQAVFFWDQSYGHQQTMRRVDATHIGAGHAINGNDYLYVLLIGVAPDSAPPPGSAPIAGGTPAIDYTPGPNMVWSSNDGPLKSHYYDPIPLSGLSGDGVQAGAGAAGQSSDQSGEEAPAAVAYVMPIDLIPVSTPDDEGAIVHVVEMGQTAWAIAVRYGVDLETLLTLNRLPENPVLRPGDRLYIQLGEGQSVPASSQPLTHTVQAGESAWSIAARYNLTLDELRALNDLPGNPVIQPGDELIIRQPPPTPTATVSAPPAPLPPSANNPPTDTPIPSSTPVALAPSPSPTLAPSPTRPPLPTATMILEKIDPPADRSGLATVVLLGVGFLLVVGMVGGTIALYLWRRGNIQVQ